MTQLSFSLQIAAFVKKTKLRADLVVRKLAFDTLSGLIRRSPVDTGRYRASHRLGINAVDRSTFNPRRLAKNKGKGKIKKTKIGSPPRPHELKQAEGLVSARPIKVGDVVYLSNSLPYAKDLEDGKSRQAPGGVYGPTVTEMQLRMQFALNSAKKEIP